MNRKLMTHCAIAIGPFGEEGAAETLREVLEQREWVVSSENDVLVIECPWSEVAWLASLIVNVPYVAHSAECPVETKNALCHYWSRKQHPEWNANQDWFQAHKHEFRAGEFIVVQRTALQLRTKDKRVCIDYLRMHPDPETAMHLMTGDGVEMEYHV